MLSSIAIATEGIGFGAGPVALQGFWPVLTGPATDQVGLDADPVDRTFAVTASAQTLTLSTNMRFTLIAMDPVFVVQVDLDLESTPVARTFTVNVYDVDN